MKKTIGSFAVLIVFSFAAGPAFAEVGKQTSTAFGTSTLCGAYPTLTPYMTVAVPTSYKSKKSFLKITTSMLVSCVSGDLMSSGVAVGGATPIGGADLPYETFDEDATSQIVTRVYYTVPESLGGPEITADSNVVVSVTSQSGTGCTVSDGTVVVEVAK